MPSASARPMRSPLWMNTLTRSSPPLDRSIGGPGTRRLKSSVGAILTQNTSWKNVERAISNLRAADLLSVSAIQSVDIRRLERLVRPSGYFRQKARKLKAFCAFLQTEYAGSLDRMFATPTIVLRPKLLGLFGIGPETADSILLYAGGHGVFVVDAYTRRMLARHGWVGENPKYSDVQLALRAAISRPVQTVQ